MKRHTLAIILIACFFTACTHSYKPGGPRESAYFDKADRRMSPTMVRELSQDQMQRLTVAWAGLIKSVELKEISERDLQATLVIEHRNFDWITDNGIQIAKYFLSQKGEGQFVAQVHFSRPIEMSYEKFRSSFMEQNKADNMIIAYGTPMVDKDQIVLMNAMARPIPKYLFHTRWNY